MEHTFGGVRGSSVGMVACHTHVQDIRYVRFTIFFFFFFFKKAETGVSTTLKLRDGPGPLRVSIHQETKPIPDTVNIQIHTFHTLMSIQTQGINQDTYPK